MGSDKNTPNGHRLAKSLLGVPAVGEALTGAVPGWTAARTTRLSSPPCDGSYGGGLGAKELPKGTCTMSFISISEATNCSLRISNDDKSGAMDRSRFAIYKWLSWSGHRLHLGRDLPPMSPIQYCHSAVWLCHGIGIAMSHNHVVIGRLYPHQPLIITNW